MKTFPLKSINLLSRLAAGEAVPASALRSKWAASMNEDGILMQSVKGIKATYRIKDKSIFDAYLIENYGIEVIKEYKAAMENPDSYRSDMVSVAGNSKCGKRRGMPGFLVNSIHHIETTINGKHLGFPAMAGLCHYVVEYSNFNIAADVVVVGLENGENFFRLEKQIPLFRRYLPADKPWLFVNRYSKSADLRNWLISIPNDYVHFGDLDLAGVRIYITEFYRYLGSRASMLIPEDYEHRISTSARHDLYDEQLEGCKNINIEDSRVLPLWECIHRFKSGYEQEGYISNCNIE